MMSPCKKCLENNWRYSFDDDTGMVIAICNNCEYEVSFLSRRAKKIQSGAKIGHDLKTEWTPSPKGIGWAIIDGRETFFSESLVIGKTKKKKHIFMPMPDCLELWRRVNGNEPQNVPSYSVKLQLL
jgi:hypothetical protein